MSKFQTKIINKFKSEGCIVLNTIKLSDNGYPDLIILKAGVAEFIEIKEGGDTLKPLQKYRIDNLIKQGFNAYCLHNLKGKIYPK